MLSADEYKGSWIGLAERNKQAETQQNSPVDFSSLLFVFNFFKKVFSRFCGAILKVKAETPLARAKRKQTETCF